METIVEIGAEEERVSKTESFLYAMATSNRSDEEMKELLTEAATMAKIEEPKIKIAVDILFEAIQDKKAKIAQIAEKAKKYDREHRRGRKPTTTDGIIRSRIRREAAIKGITGNMIEKALERPNGWYERISTGKQVLDVFGVAGIAACLGVTIDSLFPKTA